MRPRPLSDIPIFDYLLENSRAIRPNWRDFATSRIMKTGTRVNEIRQDVLAVLIVTEDLLPAVQPTKPIFAPTDEFGKEVEQETMPSKNISLSFIVPEEFDKYELEVYRKGHLPHFRIK